jgi:hypothetical protein
VSIKDPNNPNTPNYLGIGYSSRPDPSIHRNRTSEYYKNVLTNSDGTGLSIQQKLPTLKALEIFTLDLSKHVLQAISVFRKQ